MNIPVADAGKCRSSLLLDCDFLHPYSSRSMSTESSNKNFSAKQLMFSLREYGAFTRNFSHNVN